MNEKLVEKSKNLNSKHLEALKKIQNCAKKLRGQDNLDHSEIDYSLPIHYQERIGHLKGKPVKRLIIRLRSTGCEWVKRTGGCTMCGFYSATSRGEKVSKEEYINQINHVINELDLNDYPIIGIYNDGNFFNENEISMKTVEEVCNLLNNYKNIKKVNFESRIEYAPLSRIKHVKKCLNGKQLEVSFGFESANSQVMNLCINKGVPLNNFDYFCKNMQNAGVSMKPLVLMKPPFLTEREAIMDVLSTIDYLSMKGIKYADLEVTTVSKNTIVHELWKSNLYYPPMLWSIIDIVLQYKNKYKEKFNMYISPWSYSVEAIDWAKNCGRCDKEVIRSLQQYNNNFSIDNLKDLTCQCKYNEWKHRIQEVDERTIPERIIDQLNYQDTAINS